MERSDIFAALSAFAFVFAFCASAGGAIIKKLRELKAGQKIYELGPVWHKEKEGTPTMGGLCFIIPLIIAFACLSAYFVIGKRASDCIKTLSVFGLAFLNGCIGFLDDFIKVRKKRNEGLKWYEKLALQSVAAVVYVFAAAKLGILSTVIRFPFTDFSLDMRFAAYFVYVFVILLVVNAVNLTDGVDGLASCVVSVISLFFAIISFKLHEAGIFAASAALCGGLCGFLIYNFHPAKVFMGDTGSLFLGGYATGLAFASGEPLIILLSGFVCLAEVLSDVLQVSYFKISHGKRLFRMAPIHHHFEKCGWSENAIVALFSGVTLLCCLLALFA